MWKRTGRKTSVNQPGKDRKCILDLKLMWILGKIADVVKLTTAQKRHRKDVVVKTTKSDSIWGRGHNDLPTNAFIICWNSTHIYTEPRRSARLLPCSWIWCVFVSARSIRSGCILLFILFISSQKREACPVHNSKKNPNLFQFNNFIVINKLTFNGRMRLSLEMPPQQKSKPYRHCGL